MSIKMPPKRPAPPSVDAFVAGATAAVTPRPAESDLPWLNPRVRDDLKVQVNARLPERLIVQRDWLAHRLGLKKQDVLEVALQEWVRARLHEMDLQDGKQES
jgi:hypothetical protein